MNERRFFLEDTLVSGEFGAYARYRLRIFLIQRLVMIFLHVLEFTILYRIFSTRQLVSFVFIQSAFSIFSAIWWGALEDLRSRIRASAQFGMNSHSDWSDAGRQISSTLYRCGAVSIFLTLGTVLFSLLAEVDPILKAVLATYSFRLAIEIPLRAYHSGVYAVKRVYRPLTAIFLIDFVALISVLLTWRWLGVYAFPISSFIATVISALVTFHYVRKAYEALNIQLVNFRMALLKGPKREFKNIFLPAISYGSIRLGSMMVLALGISRSSIALIVTLHLLSPLISIGADWSQIFYFDFKKLDHPLLRSVREYFYTSVSGIGDAIGIFTMLLLLVSGLFVPGEKTMLSLVCLCPFIFFRTKLAGWQIRQFCEERYGVLLGLSGLTIVFLIFPRFFPHGDVFRCLYISGLFFAIWGLSRFIRFQLRSFKQLGHPTHTFGGWLEGVRGEAGPLRIRSARILKVAGRMPREEIRNSFETFLVGRGSVVLFGRSRLVWTERSVNPIALAELMIASGGLIEDLRTTRLSPDGESAWREFLAVEKRSVPGAETLTEIFDYFLKTFPGSVSFKFSERRPVELRPMTKAGRSEIFRAAFRFADLRTSSSKTPGWDVTSLVLKGEMDTVFLVRSESDPEARRKWREMLNAFNLAQR